MLGYQRLLEFEVQRAETHTTETGQWKCKNVFGQKTSKDREKNIAKQMDRCLTHDTVNNNSSLGVRLIKLMISNLG